MTKIIASIEQGEFNAQITKGFLESSNIIATVGPYSAGYKTGTATRTEFAVFVEEKDLDEATKLLKERDTKKDNK